MATISKNLTVAAKSAYTLTINNIPTGSSVTPVNDIQTWLHCADIWNKTYTTIAQVLADTSTLQALIASNNAVDYMARSTTWASSVTSNSNAMTYIGANDYCADALLANSVWCEAIIESTYSESVLNTKVPTMTSNTAPSGQASASSVWNNNYLAWKAFDNITTQYDAWLSYKRNASAVAWIQYMFPSKTKLKVVKWMPATSSWGFTSNALTKLEILGSNDGTNFTSIKTINSPTISTTNIYSLSSNNTKYKYYKLQLTGYTNNDSSSGVTYECTALLLQFYGRT